MAEDTSRLEAFSDGVFTIAITLLILEIRLPHTAPGSTNRVLWTFSAVPGLVLNTSLWILWMRLCYRPARLGGFGRPDWSQSMKEPFR
jgi:hypothetical protein